MFNQKSLTKNNLAWLESLGKIVKKYALPPNFITKTLLDRPRALSFARSLRHAKYHY
ncbi:hypothetical protein ENHY17A_30022 [Moraxellaceae bacterium 17A]|nr:hypothetical protein ENHY17A_30022 [Moraxellaceae bacterium 17A]